MSANSVPYVFEHNGKSYRRREQLGSGGFATVYRVTDKDTNQEYALKVINKAKYVKPSAIRKLQSEISIQASLDHPNILKSYDHWEDSRYHYILLELCGKSVREVLRQTKRLSEPKAAKVLKEVLEGVGYLHDNRIIHRDLKLENFLIGKDGHVRVGDFGLSAKLDYDDEKKYTVCGTPNYLCPEILRQKGHSYEVDIWAIGVCAYLLLIGRLPFESAAGRQGIYEHIKNGSYRFPSEPRLSNSAKDFINSTLQMNPQSRPNIQMLLAHPFIEEACFDEIVPSIRKPITKAQKIETKKCDLDIYGIDDILIPKRPVYEPVKHIAAVAKPIELKREDPIDRLARIIAHEDDPIRKLERDLGLDDLKGAAESNDDYSDDYKNNRQKEKEVPLFHENKEPIRLHLDSDDDSFEISGRTEAVPKHFVTRFADDSKGIGLAYLLADGTTGLVTKNNQRWVMDPHETFIQFYNDPSEKIPVVYEASDRSHYEIRKLVGYSHSLKKLVSMFDLPKTHYDPGVPMKHVKYWLRDERGTLFRMNQYDIQVNFPDKTKAVYVSSAKKMLLVRTLRDRARPVFTDVLKVSPEFREEKKRYDVVLSMVSSLRHMRI